MGGKGRVLFDLIRLLPRESMARDPDVCAGLWSRATAATYSFRYLDAKDSIKLAAIATFTGGNFA